MKSFPSILGCQKRTPKTEKSRTGNKRLLFRDTEDFSLKRQLNELKTPSSEEQETSMMAYRAAVFSYTPCKVLPLKPCPYTLLVKRPLKLNVDSKRKKRNASRRNR